MATHVRPTKTISRSDRKDRRQQAVQMRLAGYSPEEIAEQLGYVNPKAASDDIYNAIVGTMTLSDRQIEVLREIESRRMDMMLKALMPGIERGNNRSIEVAIRILERRAKMYGLDSPTQLQVLTLDSLDAQIAALTEEMSKMPAVDHG
jgi:hypothetical protein